MGVIPWAVILAPAGIPIQFTGLIIQVFGVWILCSVVFTNYWDKP